MATISSSTGYSVSAANKGFSGLVSGLDTEDMVRKLLAGTQAKIDAQNAKKQQLAWKQEAYRDVVSTLRNFQLSYFSFTSPETNLLSSTFYNTMSAVSSNSSAVRVGATQDAAAGTVNISEVTQLAASRKEKSALPVTGDLQATVDIDALKAVASEGKNTLELTLDGVKKSFQLDTSGTAADMINQLNADVQKAFGSGISVEAEGEGFVIKTASQRQVTVSGDSTVLSGLGLASGQSNKLNLNMQLGKIRFATPLQGGEYEFQINGATIKATAEDTLRSLIGKINASDAGVVVSYSAVDDSFTIESKTMGEGITIEMSQQSGNLLSSLFGVAGSANVSSNALTVTKVEDEKTVKETATAATTLGELGLGAGSLQVGGETLNFTEDDTLQSLVEKLQTKLIAAGNPDAEVSFDAETGALSIQGVAKDSFKIEGDAGGSALLNKLFNSGSLSFNTGENAREVIEEGKNAEFTINGVAMSKNTNSFELDGLNIQLLTTTAENEIVSITTTRDTDKIYKGVESFIQAYNTLLDKLNGSLDEAADYRQYPPLTAEQKADMSENEIKLWEEKAKTGLLRNDSIISALLSDMRTALYQKPEGAQFALYELGISTGEWRTKGKLFIEDPERLRSAIENNSQEIYKLFNDSEAGLAVQLNKLVDGAAKISSGSPGSLVSLAGAKGMSTDTQNTLSQQMANIDTVLENLKRSYEKEKTRYWSQFNAMEQMIATMNQQSNWLMSQFS